MKRVQLTTKEGEKLLLAPGYIFSINKGGSFGVYGTTERYATNDLTEVRLIEE